LEFFGGFRRVFESFEGFFFCDGVFERRLAVIFWNLAVIKRNLAGFYRYLKGFL
jgi:hypothetical protein